MTTTEQSALASAGYLHQIANLARHKLQDDPTQELASGAVLTPAALAAAVEQLLANEPGVASLVANDHERRQILHIFAMLPLSPALSLQLMVARNERPEIFSHSLKVAYCATALAKRSGCPHHHVVDAAAAGLFHDLGLLHVDPDLLKGRRPLQENERHHIYAHPLMSYLILERDPIWHPVVSAAVLEHHERLDGSGYPKGLPGTRLGSLGQLLAVAELGATLLSCAGGAAGRDYLEVVLNLNEGKLSHEYSAHLLAIYPPTLPHGSTPPPGKILEDMVNLSIVFQRWRSIFLQLPRAPISAFINRRIMRLEHSLASIGIDLAYWTTFNFDERPDAKSLLEMGTATQECLWQLQAIVNEVRRRWEQLVVKATPANQALDEWLASVADMSAS